MSKVQLNSYALIVLIALAMAASRASAPTQDGTKTQFEEIPITIGDWDGTEIEPDKTTREALPGASLLYRFYERPEDISPVGMVIVYGTELGNFHQPEVCLEGQGLKSVSKGTVKVSDGEGGTFDAVSVVTEQNYQRQVFVFWFYADGKASVSLGSYKLGILRDRLLRKSIRPSAMVRLDAPVTDTEEEALERIVTFANEAAPYLKKQFDLGKVGDGL